MITHVIIINLKNLCCLNMNDKLHGYFFNLDLILSFYLCLFVNIIINIYINKFDLKTNGYFCSGQLILFN